MTPPFRQARPAARADVTRAVPATFAALLLALLLALPGCNKALIDGQNAFRRGDLADARAVFDAYARGEGQKKRNRVIALLELGATQQALGEFEASNHSLAQAQAAIDRFDQNPEISLTTETRALLINLNVLPYRGWDSDRIMAATLRAMNFLFLGDPSAARASLNRAYRHQQEAVGRNAKELESAQLASKQYAAERGTGDALAPDDDPRLNQALTQRFAGLDKYEVYADYANPFTELLQGLYFLYHPADAGDAERARKSLERAAGMAPHNAGVVDDLNAALDARSGSSPPPTAHVFFATGTSPRLDAFYLELPLFAVSRKVDYVAANFPVLVENDRYARPLNVRGETAAVAEPLANLDAVVGQEFKNRLPMILVKSTLSAALKATAAYALNESLREQRGSQGNGQGSTEDQLVLLFGRLAAIGYQAATNQADRRIWASLPKKIDYARLPVPPDGRLQVQVAHGVSYSVNLDPTRSHGVWVRSVTPSSPLIIDSFPLGQSRPVSAAPSGAFRP